MMPGMVSGSVLINYFVVGAPATEWRIQVPAADLNLDVTGQNVRRDWRREGDQVIVTLPQPVSDAASILQAARECLKRVPLQRRLRLLGVRASTLEPPGAAARARLPVQGDLFN